MQGLVAQPLAELTGSLPDVSRVQPSDISLTRQAPLLAHQTCVFFHYLHVPAATTVFIGIHWAW